MENAQYYICKTTLNNLILKMNNTFGTGYNMQKNEKGDKK